MKRLLASLLVLPLLVAACSNDEGDKEKDQTSKNEQHDNKTEKDNKEQGKDKEKQTEKSDENKNDNTTSSDNQASQSESNQSSDGNSNTTSDQTTNQNNNNQPQGQQSTPANDGTASQNGNAQSTTSTQPKSTYVAPYQGQNVVPIAQQLVRQQVDRQDALKNLPNFQVALDNAQAEVNALNQQNSAYNDYAIQGENGNYTYMFSFINPSQAGTYTVVTVDYTGQAKIVDPAYRQ